MPETSCSPSQPSAGRSGRWRRLLRNCLICLVVLIGIAWYLLADELRTLNSLRRVPGTHAYVMDYYVDYNLDEVRARGIDVAKIEESFIGVLFPDFVVPIANGCKRLFLPRDVESLPPQIHRCSTIVSRNALGESLFGRNFDWVHDNCLILRTHNRHGPDSVSVIDLAYLNLDRPDLDTTSWFARIPLLFAPYYLMDGMNQYGLAVSDMSVDDVQTVAPQQPGKHDLIHSTLMRLLLDYTATTEEAIDLIRQFNIHFVDTKCHLMIADAHGSSAVVEFLEGEVRVTPSRQPWQVCTNHILWQQSEAENDQACDRYRQASDQLETDSATADMDQIMRVMQSVEQPGFTMWTSVYNLTTGEFRIQHRKSSGGPLAGRLLKLP